MLATLSIIIRDPGQNGARVNAEIARFRGSIAGRLGLPFVDRDLAVIVLVLDADLDAVNVLSGRIGKLPGTSSRVTFEPEA
ncbi:MAG TPA: iron-only hydrogenase system regulator [Spirochaetota bacterium]|nr:iron-only hydrogenase system regulator [Spirochaetota bacterium]